MPGTSKRAKITFLARSLTYGGAETQLVALAKGLHSLGHSVEVIVFYSDGPLERDLREAGVPIRSLAKKGRWDLFSFLRLIRAINQQKPEIVHGYLVVPNILTIVLKMMFPGLRVVWGIRSSKLDLVNYDRLARLLTFFESVVARFADLIIVNSYAGLEKAVARGFPKERMLVIPNGIDTHRFRPDAITGSLERKEWGLNDDLKVVGLVGRLVPIKDHPTFIRAAAELTDRRSDVRFLCVGDGPETYRNELIRLCEKLGVSQLFRFTGSLGNMPAVYNAMDVFVSSSYGEGFSNAIGEAMACNVPCVVTAVGDSSRIVGENGHVVPPKDPKALKIAIELLLENTNFKSHHDAKRRQRIVSNFSTSKMVLATETVLLGIL